MIAVGIDDPAQRAMFRPEGTAGWIVHLPPLTRVPVATSPATTAPTSPAAPEEAPDTPEAEG